MSFTPEELVIRCAFCGGGHKVERISVAGMQVETCPKVPDALGGYLVDLETFRVRWVDLDSQKRKNAGRHD